MTTFNKRLASDRKTLKLSQAEVALAGGVSRVTQIAYESGTSRPDTRYLENIRQLGFDVVYLITGSRSSAVDSNWKLIERVLSVMREYQAELGVSLPAEKQVRFMREMVEKYGNDPERAEELVVSMLKIVK